MAGLTKAQRAERAAGAAPSSAAPAAPGGPAAPAVKVEPKSKYVTIGCKVPMGVILRLQSLKAFKHPTPGGGFHEELRSEPMPNVAEIVIAGNAAEAGKLPRLTGMPNIGDYALTHNVPRDVWEEWCKQNHDSDLLKNGMLFCQSDRARAEDMAKDNAMRWSGMGPLVEKDPRNPKPINAAVTGLQKQDGTKNTPAAA